MRNAGIDIGSVSAESVHVLELESTRSNEELQETYQETYLLVDQFGVRGFPAPPPPPFPCVFLDAKRRSAPLEMAQRFSTVVSDRESFVEIISMIQAVEPKINDLAILVIGNVPIIHADIGIRKFIPIYYLGDGLVRTIDIALAMYNAKGGVLLIDEVEDGIHYSILEEYWTHISILTRKLNVQIFATTHSYECLVAAHKAYSKVEEYDLKVYRVDRFDGNREIVEYSKEELDTAIDGV